MPSVFSGPVPKEAVLLESIAKAVRYEDWTQVSAVIERAQLSSPPISGTLAAVMIELVNRLCHIESDRGPISRAHLDPRDQPMYDLIDRLLFSMAGFSSGSRWCRRAYGRTSVSTRPATLRCADVLHFGAALLVDGIALAAKAPVHQRTRWATIDTG